MPAVRPPGASAILRRCRRFLTARLARPPSTSARPATAASSASSAAQTATPSPVGLAPVAPAHTATSRSPSAICSSRETKVARPRDDSTFGAEHPLLAALAYRAFVPQACYRKEAPPNLTDSPTGSPVTPSSGDFRWRQTRTSSWRLTTMASADFCRPLPACLQAGSQSPGSTTDLPG